MILCTRNPSIALDFEVDGIYYNITDSTNNIVEVTNFNPNRLGYRCIHRN